jgi:hypothetical protein
MGWNEGPIEAYLLKRVTETGGRQRKVKWVGRDGAPDRLIWWRFPVVAFVECKGPRGRLSGEQEREIARLRGDGWPVYIVRTRDEADAFVAAMQERLDLL